MQQQVSDALQGATQTLAQQSLATREAQDAALKRLSDALSEQLRVLSEGNERRLVEVRAAVEPS